MKKKKYQKKQTDERLNQLLLKNEALKELATVDFLTKIPNRFYFDKSLRTHVERAKRYQDQFVLLLIDIDHFKIINDTHGHDVGDQFLKAAADRIQSCVRESDTFARLGGDEFAVIAERVPSSNDIHSVAQKILDGFYEPFRFSTMDVCITISIGISAYSDATANTTTLLKQADLALYLAKNAGRNQYQFYQDKIDQVHKYNLKLESLLQLADKNKEFSLRYQPVINFSTGKITQLQALLCWKNAEMGFVSPKKFIPLAEKNGCIISITEWIIEHVAEQLSRWQVVEKNIIPVIINVSMQDLSRAALIKCFEQVFKKYGLSPYLFQLDVPEELIMKDNKEIVDNIKALVKLGILININNFGVGYSSLMRLQELPIYSIKINSMLLKSGRSSDKAIDLVDAIISLSKRLGFRTIVAEIKTKEQAAYLKKVGCDAGQGSYFFNPMSLMKIQKKLKAGVFSFAEDTTSIS